MLAHIGQSDIVALQKRKPGVVVLEIQGFPHPRRHLVDKTENALIAAGPVVAHQAAFKLCAQFLVVVLVDLQKPFLAVCLSHKHFHILVLHQITIIEHILYFIAVDRKEHIARLNAHLLCNGAGNDLLHHMFVSVQVIHRSFSSNFCLPVGIPIVVPAVPTVAVVPIIVPVVVRKVRLPIIDGILKIPCVLGAVPGCGLIIIIMISLKLRIRFDRRPLVISIVPLIPVGTVIVIGVTLICIIASDGSSAPPPAL